MAIDYEQVEVRSRAELRAWLAENHERQESIWLVFGKKSSGERYVPYDDVVEEALCYGWIDGRARPLDGERRMIMLSPRRTGSIWSKINKGRIERLIAAGLMTEAGLRKIEAAKRDGSWNAFDAIDAETMPEDFAEALRRHEGAAANFAAFPASHRKFILYWIAAAKRPGTRAKRIQEAAEQASRNVRANQ